jgi:hypothetical protein
MAFSRQTGFLKPMRCRDAEQQPAACNIQAHHHHGGLGVPGDIG